MFRCIKTEAVDQPSLYLPAQPETHDFILHRNTELRQIIHWRTFRTALPYSGAGKSSRSRRRMEMSWKTPKIVEVPVGMEINMYACAARK
jgi:coenzyme PQQ precursor peptide PqqA